MTFSAQWIAIAAFLAAIAGAVGGWTTRGWKAAEDEKDRIKQEQAAWLKRIDVAVSSAAQYERWRSRASVRRQEISARVDALVERPNYAAVCFDDDGMRELRAAVSQGRPDPSEPAGALPRPATAAGRIGKSAAQDDDRVGSAAPGLPSPP